MRKSGDPKIPGGPPFYDDEIAKYKGSEILQRFHANKMSLWTKAVYGGTGITSNVANVQNSFRILTVLSTSHGGYMGLFFYLDMGRCSYVGRDADFSICKGQRSEPEDMVIVPGIFQKWEQPDPATYIFQVRKGVLWPATPPMARSNREVTAEDIAFYMNVVRKEGAEDDDSRSALTGAGWGRRRVP